MTYDVTPHEVVITVTKANDATNALTAVITYDGEDSLTVTNTFTPVRKEILVRKELEGRDWENEDFFEFTLQPVGVAPMPEDAEDGKVIVRITSETEDYTESFGAITFEKEGDYQYIITEMRGSLDGVLYDTEDHSVTVRISKADDATNALTAEIIFEEEGAEVQVILNSFEPAEAELKVRKDLQGREWRSGDYFRFKLTAGEAVYTNEKTGTSPMPEAAEDGTLIIRVEDDEEYSFGMISFVKAGTYKYTLEEIDDGLPGVTYDGAAREITVTVTKDDETNELTAVIAAEEAVITFVNPYRSEGEIILEAEKILKNKPLEDKQFSFVLKDADGAEIETVTNDADGRIVFSTISVTQDAFLQDDGTYAETITRIYTIQEVIPDPKEEWYAYDEGVYTIMAVLTDNGDGTITCVKTIVRDGEETDLVKFTNSYDEPEWTEKEVIKKWDDNNNYEKKRPESITVHLFADGVEVETAAISEADGWKKTFVKLRKYTDDGAEIVYTVTEDPVEGYTSVIEGLVVTNSILPDTGDHTDLFASLAALTVSLTACAWMVILAVKRRKEESAEG